MLLLVTNYPVYVKIGCFSSERIIGQEILVSLEVTLPDSISCDDIEYTLDYGTLLKKVDVILLDKNIKLLETTVIFLGENLLKLFPQIISVHVTIEKPIVPFGITKGANIKCSQIFRAER